MTVEVPVVEVVVKGLIVDVPELDVVVNGLIVVVPEVDVVVIVFDPEVEVVVNGAFVVVPEVEDVGLVLVAVLVVKVEAIVKLVYSRVILVDDCVWGANVVITELEKVCFKV